MKHLHLLHVEVLNNNSSVLLGLLPLFDLFHLFTNPGKDAPLLFIGKETLTLRSSNPPKVLS